VAGKAQTHVTKRLICLLTRWIPEKTLLHKPSHGLLIDHPDPAPNFGQLLVGVGPCIVVRVPCPERILVELDAFNRSAAKNHGANATVANRQCLVPLCRRLCIPEREIGCGSRIGSDQRGTD
jgi:hypothetical protein